MTKNRHGENNPMFGKTHKLETIAKLSKNIYVYDAQTKELIKKYEGIVKAKKDLKMGYDTLKKYCKSNQVFKETKSLVIFLFETTDLWSGFFLFYLLAGMPRRIPDFPDAWSEWNMISSFGSIVSLVASLIFFYIIYRTFADLDDLGVIRDQVETTRQFFDDIEEAELNGGYTTLEWTLENPPILHTFEQQPYIAG